MRWQNLEMVTLFIYQRKLLTLLQMMGANLALKALDKNIKVVGKTRSKKSELEEKA
jgi:hypothetical protein